ncbi:MAG TPA: hypothetical protein PK798_14920, partial [Flavobacteriales bacterium]|nr:hypothetical protein [Flavobacteriales bacterium]
MRPEFPPITIVDSNENKNQPKAQENAWITPEQISLSSFYRKEDVKDTVQSSFIAGAPPFL